MVSRSTMPRRRLVAVVAIAAVAVIGVIAGYQIIGSGAGPGDAGPAPGSTPSSSGSSTPSSKTSTSPSARPSTSAPDRTTSAPAPKQTSQAPKSTSKPKRPKATAKGKPSAGKPPTLGQGRPVPVDPVATKEPVALDKTAEFSGGLTARLTSIDSVRGKATRPGEIAGASLKFTVAVENKTGKAVDLNGVVIFVSYGKDRTPAAELMSGTNPLPNRVAVDSTQIGQYVFAVPKDERGLVRVEISYTGSAPTVAFEGRAES